jgi:hypothetical protein
MRFPQFARAIVQRDARTIELFHRWRVTSILNAKTAGVFEEAVNALVDEVWRPDDPKTLAEFNQLYKGNNVLSARIGKLLHAAFFLGVAWQRARIEYPR